MWLLVGTSVNRRDAERMTSASARTQVSNHGGPASKRGNRFMLNLTGLGAHFTMVAAATVYELIRSDVVPKLKQSPTGCGVVQTMIF